jgi:hypothetical protein
MTREKRGIFAQRRYLGEELKKWLSSQSLEVEPEDINYQDSEQLNGPAEGYQVRHGVMQYANFRGDRIHVHTRPLYCE